MATLTQPRRVRSDDGTHDPSKLNRVLVAFAIAVAIILVVLFAIGSTGWAP